MKVLHSGEVKAVSGAGVVSNDITAVAICVGLIAAGPEIAVGALAAGAIELIALQASNLGY